MKPKVNHQSILIDRYLIQPTASNLRATKSCCSFFELGLINPKPRDQSAAWWWNRELSKPHRRSLFEGQAQDKWRNWSNQRYSYWHDLQLLKERKNWLVRLERWIILKANNSNKTSSLSLLVITYVQSELSWSSGNCFMTVE